MNEVLKSKIEELENADKYECWYLVKQATEFDKLCYLVSALEKYKVNGESTNLESFVTSEINKIMANKQNLNLSGTHRALRVAAFFGLIRMNSSRYEDADITDTYTEIKNRCNGNYEETEKYTDIIVRQLEKMYISSEIDEENIGVRVQYRLFPVMLLYKVLIEIGKLTGDYSISTNEYRYFVATTKKYGDYLHTIFLINLLRADPSANSNLEKYREKFDNRMIQALKQLNTLIVDDSGIKLNTKYLSLVSRKVFIFELNPDIFYTNQYIDFLCSTRSLFQLPEPRLEEELYHGLNVPDEKNNDLIKVLNIDENNRVKGGHNTILYGVPGSGKSWTINNEYCNDDKAEIERLVFHPDYTYADFVGQILPDVDGDLVKYVFTAGPFTNMLKKAYENPEKRYILIIEEINRGNAPAIFGDIFQLLDRDDDGKGIFEVTNTNIAEKVYGDENRRIIMPSNLTILATMNTSDQNVFTLDTAFQRRWNMRLIDNDFDKVDNDLANAPILDTGITWRTFCETINDIIIDSTAKTSSSEDKRLGVYFIKKQDIKLPDNFADFDLDKYKALLNQKKNNSEYVLKNNEDFKKYSEILLKVRKFPEKVLKYLWDDVFKYDKSPLFEETKFKSLEDVIKHFILTKGIDRFAIFKEGIVNKLASNRNV